MLAQSLTAGLGDAPIDGLPGFFYFGDAGEPYLYPLHVVAAVTDYTHQHYYSDIAVRAQDVIVEYVGQDVRVVVDDEKATINPPIDGVGLRRVTNSFGAVGLELSFVVQIQHPMGSNPDAGTQWTTILVNTLDERVAEIGHKPLQYANNTSEELVSAMEAVFATLQRPR